jgi:hypothetical protein
MRTYLSLNSRSPKSSTETTSPAAFLHTIIDSSDSYATSVANIDSIPKGWSENTRSLLVVRADKKPLKRAAVETMCLFGQEESEKLLAQPSTERVTTSSAISKETWLAFVEKEQQKMRDKELAQKMTAVRMDEDGITKA